ncbi:HNH endonuclease [Granulicella sp. WH15]|nr:HNH endonuclease [Granulicella sp. WH15]
MAEICPAASDDLDPSVPASKRRIVFQEYGMTTAAEGKYQVDYLINPQLGGTDDIRNLWPEPYDATVWNAHAKDALEDRLHQMVCSGQLDLASAQDQIASDWISAYKRYFRTPQPV